MPDARSPHLVPTPRDGVAIVLRFARAVFFWFISYYSAVWGFYRGASNANYCVTASLSFGIFCLHVDLQAYFSGFF